MRQEQHEKHFQTTEQREQYLTELVVARLRATPPNVGYSIGQYGDFTRDELIKQVQEGTKVGQVAIDMEINYIRSLPKLAQKLG